MRARQFYPEFKRGRHAPPSPSEEIFDFLRSKVPLLRRVPVPALKEISQDAFARSYLRGQTVCQTGDPAREIWIVREGRLCVHQCGWKGAMLSIEIMVPGDVSGLAAVACRTYPGEVTATQDTRLIVVPRESVARVIERYPEFAREILYAYGQRIHYIETLLYLSTEPVEKRLIAALLYLYHKFGFTLPLNRSEIGRMAGTTTETSIRVLKRLEQRGLLRGGRGRLQIEDLSGLKAAIDTSLEL